MDTSKTYEKSIVSPLEPLEKVEVVKWYEDPIFIKMSDCPEIQKGHKWATGDYFLAEHAVWIIGDASFVYKADNQGFHHRLDRPVATLGQTKEMEDTILSGRIIWLPRQDQLQEMVQKEYEEGWRLAQRFSEWLTVQQITPINKWSMQQLWLAFVRKENHNKVWSDEGWVNG